MNTTSLITLFVLTGALLASGGSSAGDRVYQYRQSDGTILFTDAKLRNTTPLSIKYYGRPPATSLCNRNSHALEQRIRDYTPHIKAMARRYAIDPGLIKAVITAESCFNPKAVSRVGAQGLMQLMPETAKSVGVSDPFDPKQNITGGVRYLRMMLDEFKQNEELALAAYNAGPNAVKKYGGIPPYKETRNYVRKIMKLIKS